MLLFLCLSKFKINHEGKYCPVDGMPLYATAYGDSDITVDVCGLGHGVWIDRGEFKSIIAYLTARSDYEVLQHYLKNLAQESWEVFSGPELLKEEFLDVAVVLKLLRYKFATQHPMLLQAISTLRA